MNLEGIEKSRLFQGMTTKELSSCLDFALTSWMQRKRDSEKMM